MCVSICECYQVQLAIPVVRQNCESTVAATILPPPSSSSVEQRQQGYREESFCGARFKWPQGAFFVQKEAPAWRKAAIYRRCTDVRIDRKYKFHLKFECDKHSSPYSIQFYVPLGPQCNLRRAEIHNKRSYPITCLRPGQFQ